ncbi:MAG: glycosyltransferase family 39 protein [Candidatus Moranbacteria bacterium]|nr:glycosyltransferase family 39 protein [Candidatus Moranbacteria bacterium]
MLAFFDNQEKRVYGILTVCNALLTLLFVSLQVNSLALFRLASSNNPFYLGFAIAGVLSLGAVAYFSSQFDWKKWLSRLLLIWLPGILILAYGLSASRHFHYIFWIALGMYVIASGVLVSALFIGKERAAENRIDSEALTCKNWFIAQGLPTLLLILIVTGMFFVFGLSRLTEYAAVDEPLWIDGRIAKYWKNIGERDWKGTGISDKPGITVALVTGPGTFFKSTKEYRTTHYQGEVLNLKNDVKSYYFAFRLPQLLFVTLFLPLFYFFLERLLGRRHAVFGFAFIALSPVLIGITKIINPDSLLWVFAPLSLLSYLVFQKRGSFRYLIFSGIFLGLALLTKYVANILFVFFLGLIFLEYLYHPKQALIPFTRYLKKSLEHLALLTFAALTTFYILFPAVWIKPMKLFTSTLGSQAFEKVAPLFLVVTLLILLDQWLNASRFTGVILSLFQKLKHTLAWVIGGIFFTAVSFTLLDTWLGMTPYHFMELLASPKTIADKSDFIGAYLTNFYPLLFGITPLVFLFLIIAPFFFLKKHFAESVALRTSFYLIVFTLLYYLGTTVNHVGAIVRYQIIIFPLAAIIAGITLEHCLTAIHKKFSLKEMPTPVFVTSLVILLGGLTLFLTPFPLSYASALLPAKYSVDVKDMGAGSYEAAQYLNSLPEAKNMLIWTDKDGVCKFFVGRCSSSRNYAMMRENGLDYIVVSAGRQSRTTKMMGGDIANNKPGIIRFDQYYTKTNPLFHILINNRPSHFVKVFRFEQ